ncbi:MAG: hypothetical protein DRJ33_08105 [Candidatus Methanomethylicota archaeon]|uniref:Methyltransferase domain-containing protein n=1 Tax=Thermoproteota archaeon TaxID=2056631 RepID=A0A497ES89_9CREN|nr:MAG: hypothetical protein DRJ33_08105 [Candidatus Verstraetearchaeota archaeon]
MSIYDRVHFRMISFVHDTLYGLLVNPYKLLNAAGLKPGQKALEVGCGRGFFTILAIKIVGETVRRKKPLDAVTKNNLFSFREKTSRVFKFEKS